MFEYRSIKQKIMILFLTFMILFTFITPNISNAATTVKAGVAETAGNYAVEGLQAVCLILGDASVYFLHKFFYDPNKVESEDAGKVVKDKTTGMEVANFPLSPELIFEGKVESVDANFFSPISKDSIANQLRDTVAKGYVGLRYITIIGLMLILAYLGIKIMLETTAEGKAEYKKHLNDWLMAIFLVFFLHYIMVGSIYLTNRLTSSISTKGTASTKFRIEYEEKEAKAGEYQIFGQKTSNLAIKFGDALAEKTMSLLGLDNGEEAPKTHTLEANNIMDFTRMMTQFGTETEQFGYIIVYLMMVFFLIKFLWIYLKRVVYMAFLTIIAPLVALTYPLEKSKSLTRWFKEYFNLLIIQPMNLIVYVIMMSSAVSMIQTNLLYTVITLAFIDNADRIVKKIFNIGETSVSNGFAKGATAMAAGGYFMNKLTSGSANKNTKNNQNTQSENKPRSYDRPNTSGDTTADMYGAFARNNAVGNNMENESENSNANKIPEVNTPQNHIPGIDENYGNHDNINDIQNDMDSNGINREDVGEDANQNQQVAGVPNVSLGKGDNNVSTNNSIGLNANNNSDLFDKADKDDVNNKFDIKPKKISKAKSAIGKAKRFTMKNGPKIASAGGKAIATGGRVALGAVTGAAAATAVGAITLAGLGKGGPASVAKAFTKGAKAGYNAPSASYRKESNMRLARKYANDPEGYKRAVNQKQAKLSDKEFLEDKTNVHKEVYIKEFGKNQYKEKMQEALEYREHGITDDKIITKAMKEKNYTKEEKIQLANIASKVKMEKDLKKVETGLRKANVEEKKIKGITDKIRVWKGFNDL